MTVKSVFADPKAWVATLVLPGKIAGGCCGRRSDPKMADRARRCGSLRSEQGDALQRQASARHIRPIAIGRKTWLFAGSETAGKCAASIMSLLATARANGIEPHAWLTDALTRLPTTKDRDIDTLLPLA